VVVPAVQVTSKGLQTEHAPVGSLFGWEVA
jgi:hypothetical protein